MAIADRRSRSDGWINGCTQKMADGRDCGLFYWYASGPRLRFAVDANLEPTSELHTHRAAVPRESS